MDELADRLGPPANFVIWPDGSSNIYFPVTPETVDSFKTDLTLIEPTLGRLASEAWQKAEEDFSPIDEASFVIEPDDVRMHFVAGKFSEELLLRDYPTYRLARRLGELLHLRPKE